MKKFLIAVLLFPLLIGFVYGDKIYRLPTTIVSADRFASSKKTTSYKVTIVTAKQIRKLGVTSVTEAINYCTNLISMNNGYPGSVSRIAMRGAFSRDVTVMIDGLPINSSFNGSPDLSMIPLNAIERIEVVEGPISALYGSGSISGIVNIVTKNDTKNSFSIEIKNRNAYGASASVNSPLGFLFFGMKNDRGWRTNTDFNKSSFLWKKALLLNPLKLSLTASYTGYGLGVPGPFPDSNFIPEFGDSSATSIFDNQKTRNLLFKLSSDLNIKSSNLIKFNYYFNYDSLTYYSHYRSFFTNSVLNSFYRYATIKNMPELLFVHSDKYFELGVGSNADLQKNYSRTDEYGDSNILADSSSWNVLYNTYSSFQEAKLNFIPHMIVENKLRYDYVSLKKDTISRIFKALSYSFGAVFNYNAFTLKTNYGTAFKNPGLNDLFFPYMGNPDLKPEKGREFSVLLGANFPIMNVNVSYFKKSIDDLIYWSGMMPENINSVSINGIEGQFGLSSSYVTLSTNLTYQNSISHDIIDTVNIPVSRTTPYSPAFKGSYDINIRLPYNTTIGQSGTYITSYVNYFKNYTTGGIDTVKTDNALILNGNARIDISGVKLVLSIWNFLDYKGIKSFGYSAYDRGYPYNGRRISLKVSTSF
ncbi:MAG: TonB-dependent receptor [Proteobacteria bacterium]|nr:TonB-dependent receptor [Pseudomonadota bacterium]